MTSLPQSPAVPRSFREIKSDVDPVYRQIRDLVYEASGMYKTDEKLYLLANGCSRRITQLSVRSPHEYWQRLTSPSGRDAELRQLLNELTIGETCLFRSPPQLDALRKVILPELSVQKTRQAGKKLRIWSAGCSTGEEPYTLAMNILEESERLLRGWTVEIFATDLNDRSVETAKIGIYGKHALRNTPAYFKRKYFSTVGAQWLQVRPEVKKLITFDRLNFQDDGRMAVMKGMDVIFCCNVLIYFGSASKSKVIDHFFENLNHGGYFFLGTSETLMNVKDSFRLVDLPATIAYRKPDRGDPIGPPTLRSGRLPCHDFQLCS